MCLPFSCGGGGRGDGGRGDGDVHEPRIQESLRPPQQARLAPRAARSDEEDNGPPYNKPSPVEEAYGHHATNMRGVAGGEGKAAVNKNGGGRKTTDFGFSDNEDVSASVVGVARGRESQGAAGKIMAPTTPATHPRDAAGNMKAPVLVRPMFRRGGEDN